MSKCECIVGILVVREYNFFSPSFFLFLFLGNLALSDLGTVILLL